MNFKNLMITKALVCLLFGILLLAIPNELISIFGATLSAGGMFTAREYGAALFGNLFLCWFAKSAGESEARKAIIIKVVTSHSHPKAIDKRHPRINARTRAMQE